MYCRVRNIFTHSSVKRYKVYLQIRLATIVCVLKTMAKLNVKS